MILTAIVISMGIAAFVLAMTYRSYRLNTAEEVGDDPGTPGSRSSPERTPPPLEATIRPETTPTRHGRHGRARTNSMRCRDWRASR